MDDNYVPKSPYDKYDFIDWVETQPEMKTLRERFAAILLLQEASA